MFTAAAMLQGPQLRLPPCFCCGLCLIGPCRSVLRSGINVNSDGSRFGIVARTESNRVVGGALSSTLTRISKSRTSATRILHYPRCPGDAYCKGCPGVVFWKVASFRMSLKTQAHWPCLFKDMRNEATFQKTSGATFAVSIAGKPRVRKLRSLSI